MCHVSQFHASLLRTSCLKSTHHINLGKMGRQRHEERQVDAFFFHQKGTWEEGDQKLHTQVFKQVKAVFSATGRMCWASKISITSSRGSVHVSSRLPCELRLRLVVLVPLLRLSLQQLLVQLQQFLWGNKGEVIGDSRCTTHSREWWILMDNNG